VKSLYPLRQRVRRDVLRPRVERELLVTGLPAWRPIPAEVAYEEGSRGSGGMRSRVPGSPGQPGRLSPSPSFPRFSLRPVDPFDGLGS
jgi:hypothetical protein